MKSGFILFSVGRKLFLSFLLLIVLIGFLGIASLRSEERMAGKSDEITTNWMTGVEIANHLNYLTEHMLTLQFKIMTDADQSQKQAFRKEADDTLKVVDDKWTTYAATYANAEDKAVAEELQRHWKQFKIVFEQAAALGKQIDLIQGANGKGSEVRSLMAQSEKIFDDMQEDMNRLVGFNHDGAVGAVKESRDIYDGARASSFWVMAAALIIAISLAVLLNRLISRPIKQVSLALRAVSEGDLTAPAMATKRKDEIGALIQSLNVMTASLKSLIVRVSQASQTVAASSEELLASSEQNAEATKHVAEAAQAMADGSGSQLHSAVETSRAMEEMAAGIQRIAETSSAVSELTQQSGQLAERGNQAIASAMEKMDAISRSVEQTGSEIKLLESHSGQIGDIVELIGGIASQTNLLALNASIEAARAGEHGRGFAVVAGEVRKLSEQSAESVQNIAEVIALIQEDTLKAVRTMDRSLAEVRLGLQAVADAEESFRRIAMAAGHVSEMVQEVAASSQQMAAGSEQVSASVHDMSAVAKQATESTQSVAATTEEQLASVQEITAAAQTLSAIAVELSDTISKVKV
ncbi:methyl-accepting chemotaxis protein [Paenibacillus sacheonensis]|uniref:HAMP domain-containing protein n=1 Tax=Paenibacillus sacheonensis TaxID=742054 RepID=A0A7X5BZN1_9BACL|nr:HAMP domain-containing methyl-accepting chemotaxis protein [Paenibacillus sacheonensis]MBM7567182.1 methyl-accepting chemotaxis protein [Paenibacillus sacheonensis]NBC70892.1 HAMP domain-containing protein [Paenibacillus sacheonensis]